MKKETIITSESATFSSSICRLWEFRGLILFLSNFLILRRVKGTILGKLWLIIRPLVPALLSSFVFGNLMRVQSDGIPYLLFFFTGNALWAIFSSVVTIGTRTITWNLKIISKIYFPRIIIPFSVFGVVLIELLVNAFLFSLFIVLYFLFKKTFYLKIGWNNILSIYSIVLVIILGLGITFFTCLWNTKARDIRFTLPFILQGWLLVTPIIYPLSIFPEKWKWIAVINPLTYIFEGFKWSLLGETGSYFPLSHLIYPSCFCFLILIIGFWYFVKNNALIIND